MINRTDLLITQNCVVHFVDALADVHRSGLQGELEKSGFSCHDHEGSPNYELDKSFPRLSEAKSKRLQAYRDGGTSGGYLELCEGPDVVAELD